MHSSTDIITATLEYAKMLGADAADAVLFDTTDISTSRRLGKQEGLERSENQVMGLRLFTGGKNASASSTDISQESLRELAERTIAMARVAPADIDAIIAPQELHPKNIVSLELCDDATPDFPWLAEQCRLCEEAALSVAGITNSEGAEAHCSQSRIYLAVANNKTIQFLERYATSHFSVSVSVLAGSGTDMQRDYEFSSARYRQDLDAAAAIGVDAAQRTLKRLNPRKIPSCQIPVLFDPRVSKGLLAILANAISGSAITRGASFLKEDLGTELFPKAITIIDDPHIKRGLGSKPFDGEGVKNEKRVVVKDGMLTTWLLDLRTASKLKLTSTGHAVRGVGSPPTPAPSNLYMQKGNKSQKALLKEIGRGLYVTETFGMGVNIVTGDYSQGASGFWVENGEITYPVSEITLAGKLKDMFRTLVAADDLSFRYAINAPTLLVERMTVAGV